MLQLFFKQHIIPDIRSINGSKYSKGLIDKRILLLPVYIPVLSIGGKTPNTIAPLNIAKTLTFILFDNILLTSIYYYSFHIYKQIYS